MAARKQRWHPDEVRKRLHFYVYAIIDEIGLPLYIGKGSGRRNLVSAKKHGGKPTILEYFKSERDAYLAERRYIRELRPLFNKSPGGNGGLAIKIREYKDKETREMERIGSRAYVARFLLKKLDESNCELHGVSKVGLNRLRAVADGIGL